MCGVSGWNMFLHENTVCVRDKSFLISGHIFGYIFHKSSRVVTLYTSNDTNEFVQGQDPCLVLPDKDWNLFFNRIWKDLNGCREESLYVTEWDTDDRVHIFACEDMTKLSGHSRGVTYIRNIMICTLCNFCSSGAICYADFGAPGDHRTLSAHGSAENSLSSASPSDICCWL